MSMQLRIPLASQIASLSSDFVRKCTKVKSRTKTLVNFANGTEWLICRLFMLNNLHV